MPITPGLPVWPGDPPVTITPVGDAAPDADANMGSAAVSLVCMGSHTGTHVDPPAHFFPRGATVDELALEHLIGPAWVAHVDGPGPITALALSEAGVPDGTRRLLLRTSNSDVPAVQGRGTGTSFHEDFTALSPDAALWLRERGIGLFGIDGPSVDPYDASGEPVHRLLLSLGVIIVENLALRGIASGPYQLCCLPLRILGGDGAPARAVLISEE